MTTSRTCTKCGAEIAGTDSGWSRCPAHPPTVQEVDDMAVLTAWQEEQRNRHRDWRKVGTQTTEATAMEVV